MSLTSSFVSWGNFYWRSWKAWNDAMKSRLLWEIMCWKSVRYEKLCIPLNRLSHLRKIFWALIVKGKKINYVEPFSQLWNRIKNCSKNLKVFMTLHRLSILNEKVYVLKEKSATDLPHQDAYPYSLNKISSRANCTFVSGTVTNADPYLREDFAVKSENSRELWM